MMTCMVYKLVENKISGIKITSLVIALIFLGFFMSEIYLSLAEPKQRPGLYRFEAFLDRRCAGTKRDRFFPFVYVG